MQVLDTTLRDGEQTPGVNFSPDEKLAVAKALLRSGLDAMEIASAGISDGEAQALRQIMEWAHSLGVADRFEILGFVDESKSVDWIVENGGRVLNLLAKGSEKHCRVQLKKSPDVHFNDIASTVLYAAKRGLTVNVYLEDWSQGMRASQAYVMELARALCELPVNRVMLADTLGVLTPEEVEGYIRLMKNRFSMPFDFQGHNDYGLAVANSLAALRAGVQRVHVTVNGIGERAGNTNLAPFVVAARDLYGIPCNVEEQSLGALSDLVAGISGVETAANAPVVGRLSVIQGCGIHADGDRKGNLYQNRLDPARFGLVRGYDLGKTAGLASIEQNCQELGIDISAERQRALLAKIKELGDQKVAVTQADIPLLLNEILSTRGSMLEILDYEFTARKGALPTVRLCLRRNEEHLVAHAEGAGQYEAFLNALRSVLPGLPEIVDYRIGISRKAGGIAPPEATITWRGEGELLSTRDVDSDPLVAAMKATIRILNYLELKREFHKSNTTQSLTASAPAHSISRS